MRHAHLIQSFPQSISKAVIVSFAFCSFIAPSAKADHPTVGFGSGLAGPIVTISAQTLPRGKWAFSTQVEYAKFSRFADEELEQFGLDEMDIHSTDALASTSVGIAYGVTKLFTLSARLPHNVRTNIREGELEMGISEVHNNGNSTGLGDMTLLGQYRLGLSTDQGFEVALIGGAKIPVGNDNVVSDEGELFEAEHQPGSGSWDPILGIAISGPANGMFFSTNALYTVATEGEQEVNLGNILSYNGSIAYRINGKGDNHHHNQRSERHEHSSSRFSLNVIVEINGEYRSKVEHLGEKEEHSGGNLVYLSPGIRASTGSRWSGFMSVGVPIIDAPNGVQHTTSLRAIGGVSFTL